MIPKGRSLFFSMQNIQSRYESGEVIPDNEAFSTLVEILKHPTCTVKYDVEFLISKIVCPVEGDEDLLCIVFDQPTFPGQLNVAQQLVAAGAPTNNAKIIANSKFENLFELVTSAPLYS